MKHCPNAQCPYAVYHGNAAEYVDDTENCSDCGSSLAPGSSSEVTDPQDDGTKNHLWRRLGVTLLVPIAVHFTSMIRLPGITSVIPIEDAELSQQLGIVAFGISPILTAYILVEIVAAIVPRWRRLRIGGPIGRRKLSRVSVITAVGLTIFQAWGYFTFIQSYEYLVLTLPVLVPLLALVVGIGLLMLLANLIDRYGLGNGLAVLFIYEFVVGSADVLGCLSNLPEAGGFTLPTKQQTMLALVVLAGVIAATVFVLRGKWNDPSKLVKIDIAAALVLLTMIDQWVDWGHVFGDSVFGLSMTLQVLILIVVLGITALINSALASSPQNVATLLHRCGDRAAAKPPTWRGLPILNLKSVLYLALLILAGHWVSDANLCLAPIVGSAYGLGLITCTAVVLDLIHDWRAFHHRPNLVSTWPLHRVYAIGPVLRLLERNGISAHPRNANTRTIMQFFGPFVPIELMVPREQLAEARQILYETLVKEENDGGDALLLHES